MQPTVAEKMNEVKDNFVNSFRGASEPNAYVKMDAPPTFVDEIRPLTSENAEAKNFRERLRGPPGATQTPEQFGAAAADKMHGAADKAEFLASSTKASTTQ